MLNKRKVLVVLAELGTKIYVPPTLPYIYAPTADQLVLEGTEWEDDRYLYELIQDEMGVVILFGSPPGICSTMVAFRGELDIKKFKSLMHLPGRVIGVIEEGALPPFCERCNLVISVENLVKCNPTDRP